MFALAFALFLFSVICLVADSAYLYVWSGRVTAAAQLGAQSGADAVDPRYLYEQPGPCVPPAPACAVQIVDINPQDREGALFAFQRACIQAGDQSAQMPRDSARPRCPEDSGRPAGSEWHVVRERWMPGVRGGVARGASAHSDPGIPRHSDGARHRLRGAGCRDHRRDVGVHRDRMGTRATALSAAAWVRATALT